MRDAIFGAAMAGLVLLGYQQGGRLRTVIRRRSKKTYVIKYALPAPGYYVRLRKKPATRIPSPSAFYAEAPAPVVEAMQLATYRTMSRKDYRRFLATLRERGAYIL